MAKGKGSTQGDTTTAGRGRPVEDGEIRTIWTDPWGLDPRTGAPPPQKLPRPGSQEIVPKPGLGDDCSDDW
jgi:hypothetical protein